MEGVMVKMAADLIPDDRLRLRGGDEAIVIRVTIGNGKVLAETSRGDYVGHWYEELEVFIKDGLVCYDYSDKPMD